MNLGYTTNIPLGSHNPSNDWSPMNTNTNSINSWVQVDHHGFGDPVGGYHKIIHQDPQALDPASIAGIMQLYVKNVTPNTTSATTDTQLFAETGGGGVSQLTGNFAAIQGYQWVGGILLMWGTTALSSGSGGSSHRTGAVIFKDRGGTPSTIPFPNNCFMVVATFTNSDTTDTTASNTVSINNVSTTGFTWLANSSTSSFLAKYPNFYWLAIGN